MKTKITVVAGFLGGGKTTFINQLVNHYTARKEKVLVLQLETGEVEVAGNIKGSSYLKVAQEEALPPPQKMTSLLETYSPHRLIIESNGMLPLEPLLQVLESRPVRKNALVENIIAAVHAPTYHILAKNLGESFLDPIVKAHKILLTSTGRMSPGDLPRVRKEISSLNRDAPLFETETPKAAEGDSAIKEILSSGPPMNLDRLASFSLFYVVILALAIGVVLQTLDQGLGREYLDKTLAFNTIFISILLQAFPFILIGVLISGLIQVFVSESFILRFFSRNLFLSTATALVVGVFFPVCDCAIIPVMRRLVQKGVPLSAAVTFMLAAPIVDPVVIASTFYAFPEKPYLALWRLGLGILIAILVGLIFLVLPARGKVLREGSSLMRCQCGYCGNQSSGEKGGDLAAKLVGALRHAGAEFFQVGQFLVIAAAFSTYMQTSVSPSTVAVFSENPVTSLLTMQGFAFVLSICSTSDAFIARNFSLQFATGPVLGFMVFGAMLDIKNLLLLLGSYQKAFVVKLVLLIILVSFTILYLASVLFF